MRTNIFIAILIIQLMIIFIVNKFVEIKNQELLLESRKISIEEKRLIKEVCPNGGSYNYNSLNCK